MLNLIFALLVLAVGTYLVGIFRGFVFQRESGMVFILVSAAFAVCAIALMLFALVAY